MTESARIIIVDSGGEVSRLVRGIVDVADYALRIVDVQLGEEVLDEVEIGQDRYHFIISASHMGDMSAATLASHLDLKRHQMMVIGGEDDLWMSLEDQKKVGFVYLQRPLDVHQFFNAIYAGIVRKDIFRALNVDVSEKSEPSTNMGPIPDIDLDKSRVILDKLMTDLGADSVLIVSREGEVLVRCGTAEFVEHDVISKMSIGSAAANIEMKEMAGGDVTSLQFYDGKDRDIYILSIGLHHVLCVVYRGESGQRHLGAVSNFGRKAALKLIDILGASAFILNYSRLGKSSSVFPRLRSVHRSAAESEASDEVATRQIQKAELFQNGEEEADAAEERLDVEAIEDMDLSIFDNLGTLNVSEAEVLFSMDDLEDIANENQKQLSSTPTLDQQSARDIGVIN